MGDTGAKERNRHLLKTRLHRLLFWAWWYETNRDMHILVESSLSLKKSRIHSDSGGPIWYILTRVMCSFLAGDPRREAAGDLFARAAGDLLAREAPRGRSPWLTELGPRTVICRVRSSRCAAPGLYTRFASFRSPSELISGRLRRGGRRGAGHTGKTCLGHATAAAEVLWVAVSADRQGFSAWASQCTHHPWHCTHAHRRRRQSAAHALLRDSHVLRSLGSAPGPQARELEMMLHQPLAQRPVAD